MWTRTATLPRRAYLARHLGFGSCIPVCSPCAPNDGQLVSVPSSRCQLVIDAHQHIGRQVATGIGGAEPEWDVSADIAGRIALMDRRGVDGAVVIAGHGYLRPRGAADTSAVNDAVASYRAARPDRFVAAIGIAEPLHGEQGIEEIERCASELGVRGISYHTRFQGVSLESPWVHRGIERIGELGLVPFIHAVGESASEQLWKVDVLAADFPDLTFVVLDAFSTFEQSALVPHVAARRPNLIFDTALAHGLGFVAALVDRCDPSRVVYGSDLHSTDTERPQLHHLLPELLTTGWGEAATASIVGQRILDVLGLDASSLDATGRSAPLDDPIGGSHQ